MDLRTRLAGLRDAITQRRRFDRTMPTVAGKPLVGSLVGFRRDTFGTLRRAAAQGDLVRLDLLHKRVCLTGHPDGIAALLETPDAWERSTGLTALLGRNVLTTVGAEWADNRARAQPSFHQKMATRAAAAFARDAAGLLDAWRRPAASGEVIDLALEASRLFAHVAPRLFGLPLRPDEAQRFPIVVKRLQSWAFRLIAGGQPRTKQINDDFAFLEGIIDRALATPAPAGEPPSFLERLRQDHAVDRKALQGHLMLMLLAAADNPPNTFAFTVWLLAHHPETAAALRSEIAALGGADVATPETMAAIDELPLLDRVIHESMRLYPPVWFLARVARQDTELLGYRVPAGTMAFACTWHAHRHPDFWRRPEDFDPDRFLPEAVARRHRHAYLPFGAGERRCIGSRLALLEIKALLVLFLQRFRPHPGADDLDLEGNFALRGRRGVPVRLEAMAAEEVAS